MWARILRFLRGDRGEGSMIAVIGGTTVFLIASVAVAGTITLALAGATRSQANTEITQATQTFVTTWKATPYLKVATVSSPTKVSLGTASDGHTTLQGWQTVTKDPQGAYHLRVAALRYDGLSLIPPGTTCAATLNGSAGQDNSCLLLEATIAPSPFDLTPPPPTGITQEALAAPRGVFIASVATDKVAENNAVDLRISINANSATKATVAMWRLTLTCDDQTSLANNPDSSFNIMQYTDATNTKAKWVTARVTLDGLDQVNALPGSCANPSLRFWSNDPANVQPTLAQAAVANVKIYRVAGADQ